MRCLSALGCLAVILASPVRADPIRPWAGARAHVTAADQSITNSGRTASAAAEGEGIVSTYYATYDHINNEYGGFSAEQIVRGSGSAEATGSAGGLLHVGSSYGSPHYGSELRHVSRPPFRASAEWADEAITIRPPLAGPMPESVRVEIAFDFTLYGNGSGSSFTLIAGDKHIEKSVSLSNPYGESHNMAYLLSSVESPDFDSLVFDPNSYLPSGHATLHLDLPLDESGRTDPFSLLLESNAVPTGNPYSNSSESVTHRDFTLSLLDITLPDGTSATSAGYAVSFDSGLSWPQPVPEPLPAAAWAIVGLAGAFIARRRAVAST